jgi:hypothetical protein
MSWQIAPWWPTPRSTAAALGVAPHWNCLGYIAVGSVQVHGAASALTQNLNVSSPSRMLFNTGHTRRQNPSGRIPVPHRDQAVFATGRLDRFGAQPMAWCRTPARWDVPARRSGAQRPTGRTPRIIT